LSADVCSFCSSKVAEDCSRIGCPMHIEAVQAKIAVQDRIIAEAKARLVAAGVVF